MDYRGQHCPICGKEFCDGDDIVVCPECGTPYHRECYKTAGHCVNEERHGESFEWKPETAPHAEEKNPNVGQNTNDDGHKVVFCPVCGRENPAEEPNCLNCGARLYNNQNGGKAFIPPVELPNMDNQPFGKVVNISPMDMLGRNTVGDTAEFIGVNAQSYIPKFYKMQQEKKKLSWNWAAFFFAPYWFFYRKMQNIGCIFIAVLLVISGACTTKSVMAASSNVMQVYENYTNGKASAEDMMKAYEEYEKLPANIISNVLVLFVHAAAGLCANYLYAKKAEKGVYEIRKLSQNPEQYRISLFRSGGVSFFWLMASVLLYIACTNALSVVLARFLM